MSDTVTYVFKDGQETIRCKDCQQAFRRKKRSRLCPKCRSLRRVFKKSIRNRIYYKRKKAGLVRPTLSRQF